MTKPVGMKRPAAASSSKVSRPKVEDAETLAQRKAQEAEEALQGFAREHQVDTASRCEFTGFEAGDGKGRLACFSWRLVRPDDKLHLFDHDCLKPQTICMRLDKLRRAEQSVSQPCLTGCCSSTRCLCWRMQLRWEQFHNVAADAQKRATMKFGMPIQCEYMGAAVPKGRGGGAPTYEANPAKWPASALKGGRASHAEIWFRFWSVHGSELVSLRVDHLRDQQLALPSPDVCEAKVVRRRPRVGPTGEQVDMYINAALVAEYDEAYLKFKTSVEDKGLSVKQRHEDFQASFRKYSRDVRPSWFQVDDWAKQRNREVIFLTQEEHEELCLYHQTIFGQDGLETGNSRAPLRVLWADVLHRIALSLSPGAGHVTRKPRSLLVRKLSGTDDHPRGPERWKTWYKSYDSLAWPHGSTSLMDRREMPVSEDCIANDFKSFGAFVGVTWAGTVDYEATQRSWGDRRLSTEPRAISFDNLHVPALPCTRPVEDRPCYWFLPKKASQAGHEKVVLSLSTLCSLVCEVVEHLLGWPWIESKNSVMDVSEPGSHWPEQSPSMSWTRFVGLGDREAWGEDLPDFELPDLSKLIEADSSVDCHVMSRRADFVQTMRERLQTRTLATGAPLVEAAESGDLHAVRRILEGRAHADAQNTNGQTALHLAAARGHLPVVEALCGRYRFYLSKEQRFDGDRYYANSGCNTDFFLRQMSRSEKDGRIYPQTENMDTTISSKTVNYYRVPEDCHWFGPTSPHIVDIYGRTALCYACGVEPLRTPNEDIVRFLVRERKADPNVWVNVNSDSKPDPLLRWVVAHGYKSIAVHLLEGRADPNLIDRMGNTALHGAVRTGDLEMIWCLLAYAECRGTDIEKRDRQGRTPLELAAERNDNAAVNVLHCLGASIDGLRGKRSWSDYLYLEEPEYLENRKERCHSETRETFTPDAEIFTDEPTMHQRLARLSVRQYMSIREEHVAMEYKGHDYRGTCAIDANGVRVYDKIERVVEATDRKHGTTVSIYDPPE